MINSINHTFSKLLLVTIILLNIISCSEENTPQPKDESTDIEQIVLLHINDLHANIDAFPKIAAFVNSVKDTCENVFVVSAGDIFSGNPMVDMYKDPGFPVIDLMNQVDFDLSVIGNHEFDYGQNTLNKRMEQAEFPFICANINASGATLNQPKAYTTLTSKNGFEMEVIGLIETGSKVNDRYIPSTHPDKVNGCIFPYYKTEIKEYVDLKKDDNLLIVLSHLGLGSDEKLAVDNDEIDLIIGGHSHSSVTNPQKFNNALVCQAGSYGRYMGVVHLQVKNKKVVNSKAYLKNLTDYNISDSNIQSIVDAYNNNPALNRKIGTASNDITKKEEIGCLMTDAITWKFDVDFAFQNSGGIRNSFSQGDILVKDVYANDPFKNEVVIFNLTHAELFSLIKNSRQGDLKVSGMKITHQQNGYIALTDYEGNFFDRNKTYQVALNSYVASAYKFDHAEEGIWTGVTSADALIEFIEHKNNIDYNGVMRIFYE